MLWAGIGMGPPSNQILFSDGTAAAPVIAFQGDVDTGMYRVQANTIGMSTGTQQKVTITDTSAPAQYAKRNKHRNGC